MIKEHHLSPAIFLMGATASGKTALAVQLAQALETEVISVDSMLVYQGMDIGTAKPTWDERQGIRHHLMDILDPIETYSSGRFRKDSLELMTDLSKRGKVPLLVGGTMLYFNTLFHGLADLPDANPEIRKKLESELAIQGSDALYKRLECIDAESAAKIHPNDPQRIQRALEVYEITGKPISQFFREARQHPLPFRKIKLIIAPENRQQLHEKIAQRFQHMLAMGLIDEVKALFARGDLTEKMPAVRAVGYRQVWSYLCGEYDRQEMTERGIIATRQLAKRQFTWLRREQDALNFMSSDANLFEKVLQAIRPLLR